MQVGHIVVLKKKEVRPVWCCKTLWELKDNGFYLS